MAVVAAAVVSGRTYLPGSQSAASDGGSYSKDQIKRKRKRKSWEMKGLSSALTLSREAG
jgi:hypothetical protein